MNILFLNNSEASPIKGGVQAVSHSLYQYFKNAGHNVVMLSWIKGDAASSDFVCLPESHCLLSDMNCRVIDCIIREKKIQLVMNHTCLNPNYAKVVRYIKRNYNLPILSVFHSSPYGMFGIRKYPRLALVSCQLFRNTVDNAIRLLFWMKYHVKLSMLAEYSDNIVMLSDKFIPEFLFFTSNKYLDKLKSLPNPLKYSNIGLTDIGNKENLVLFVGRLSAEKGLYFLLEIWAKIEKAYPAWRLGIVGDGPERQGVESKIKEYGLQHVTLHGFQNPASYYAKAKMFCMTSLFEGFGLVIIEAMHFGVIPLAFNSYANLTDIINNGITGFVIPAFDRDIYAEKIIELIEKPDLMKKMSLAAYEESHNYQIDVIGEKWEILFKEVVND